ncbi:MAG: VCBS repeat-containing protein [Candidatus Hydrogenedentes bacterium]|nr:VCBS repeat-containing protein [Candidatus Hydrogenedentota bacterium]
MCKPLVLAVLAASTLVIESAFSQEGAGSRGVSFDRLDRNGDGRIGRDEYEGPLFEQVDTDKDGFVTQAEFRGFVAGRRAGSPDRAESSPIASPAPGTLTAIETVFELCVYDAEALVRFYRDGIGMREIESPVKGAGALLEWAGCYLRLREVAIEPSPPATGSPVRQMLASNGYRWFSLWFADAAAVGERLVAAGYPAPVRGGNVWMTRDPEGNVVELMGLPRGVTEETFTWGMAVSDEAVAREFYGGALGLHEFEPWTLPPPFNVEMYLFATGAGRVKFAAPPGERPNEAVAGDNALGLRSLTLREEDLGAALDGLRKRGVSLEEARAAAGSRWLVRDPDGNRIYLEQASAEVIAGSKARASASESRPQVGRAVSRDRDGADWQATRARLLANAPEPAPHNEEIVEQRPGEPPLKKMPEGDAAQDATGRGQLFESISVPGITDFQEGMNGFATADLNDDGLLDLLTTFSPRRGTGQRFGAGEKLRVFLNEGDFVFKPHTVTLLDSKVSLDDFGRGQVPVLADFNRDGHLDLFVTRHAPMSGGVNRRGIESVGNSLFVSDGAWDRLRDVSEAMGIRNELAYNRQPSIGDVNRDGWLDIAIGCDNIKDAQGGFPHSRLYIFRPSGERFEDGRFEDIGGTELIPDFGGFHHDPARDKAGPDINLYDLDNDGDLDLVQTFHVDVMDLEAPYTPVEYRQGVFCWKNMLVETGQFRFEKIVGNGLACEARLRYDREAKTLSPEGSAPGLPYVSFADTDNDGDLDLLAVGPGMPGWAPRTEYAGGRFWRNLGGFLFEEATDASGLTPVTWTYAEWMHFFDAPIASRSRARMNADERKPYYSDAVFGDFDNDGWQDVVVLDRSESANISTRAALFMNRGQGAFELQPTTFSGLDAGGISGEAADLNNDGLLDLVIASDPDNSGIPLSMARYESRVYWNTGLHGARENHWLRLRFSGLNDAELIGARVEVRDPGSGKLLGARWIHPAHAYKSGGALEAHFGLGEHDEVELMLTLQGGETRSFTKVNVDNILDLDFATGNLSRAEAGTDPR